VIDFIENTSTFSQGPTMPQQNQTPVHHQPGKESGLSFWHLALVLVPVGSLLFLRPTADFSTNILMVVALWGFVFLCWFMGDRSRKKRTRTPR